MKFDLQGKCRQSHQLEQVPFAKEKTLGEDVRRRRNRGLPGTLDPEGIRVRKITYMALNDPENELQEFRSPRRDPGLAPSLSYVDRGKKEATRSCEDPEEKIEAESRKSKGIGVESYGPQPLEKG